MKSTTFTALAAAILFLCSAVAVNAQDTTNQNQQMPARHHMRAGNNNNNETATGCLQQGTNGGSYTLSAQDGSTWQLTSGAMDLGKYVGKDITVAGIETGAGRAHASNVSTSQQNDQHGPMDVLDLSVNNESCQGR